MELSTSYLLSQVLAGLALSLGVCAFFQRRDTHLKLYISAASTAMVVHFALLGAWMGVLIGTVGIARYLSSIYTKATPVFLLFLLAGIGLGVWRYHATFDFLPIVASVFSSVAVFKTRGVPMRVLLMVVSTCWFIYNGIYFSVFGMLLEGFYVATNAYNLLHPQRRAQMVK
ncbi:MAG: hypothetical protein GC129_05495 [Proteobacteria bacterium]|nr:hypothetical protein [Pseudomonadota bacterium]